MHLKTAEQIALEQMARESGMLMQKDYLLERARIFCEAPAESAAFHPEQKIRNGQIKTADDLFKFLKG